MKKQHILLLTISLLFSLFVYFFYRTEKTLVTQIYIYIFSEENYFYIRNYVVERVFLPVFVVKCLPGGLWVFCATLLSKGLFIRFGHHQFPCMYFPLIISVGLEFCQLFKISKGVFDIRDIFCFIIFWLIVFFWDTDSKKSALLEQKHQKIACVFCYMFIFLAHVCD